MPEAQQLLAQVFGRRAASSVLGRYHKPDHFSLVSAAGVTKLQPDDMRHLRSETFTHEPLRSTPKPDIGGGLQAGAHARSFMLDTSDSE